MRLMTCTFVVALWQATSARAEAPPTLVAQWPIGVAGGIVVAPDRSLFVAMLNLNTVKHLSPIGQVLGEWVAGNNPVGIALDVSGEIFVTSQPSTVTVYSQVGAVLRQWGSYADYEGLNNPIGVALDGAGNVYVASENQNVVKEYTHSGGFVRIFCQAFHATGVAIDHHGNVYVGQFFDASILKCDRDGNILATWTRCGPCVDWGSPFALAADAEDNIYLASLSGWVLKFSSNGDILSRWGSEGSQVVPFSGPRGIAVDVDGCVYVADENGVQKFCSAATPSRTDTWGMLKTLYR